ncbi:universal stress protein [Kitasatospora cineracea]|uniref:universal stress protein n=1 Tax=Kitasatospora cineracea TaxID=88074 RepID=UPI0037B10F6C
MNGLITVGYDGTPGSAAAARWAAHEAGLRGMRVELLLAWPWTAPHLLGTPDAVAESRRWLARQEAGLRARSPGVDVTAVHRSGPAQDVLLPAAERSAVLAPGSRGLGALHGYFVGAVGRDVLGRAACPVVLVRADEQAPRPAREVVLGLGLDHRCDAALRFAFEAAALRAAPLRVVHAWRPPRGSGLVPAVTASLARVAATEALQRFTGTLDPWREEYPDVEVVPSLLQGGAAGTLVEAADRPDLLVVGRRTRGALPGPHLGPVTQAAVHHVHGPLAVVPCD